MRTAIVALPLDFSCCFPTPVISLRPRKRDIIHTVNDTYQNMKLALYFCSAHNSSNETKKRNDMNIARNMEAVFLLALALSGVSAFAAVPLKHMTAAQAVSTGSKMAVVTITAKRLTPAQKAQLGA
jgi:hypothetical protein